MSEPKFTPGPWVYWRNNNNRIQIGASTNYSIAELWKTPMGETESNAHLIAAAPELYEALGLCLSMLERADLSTGYCCCGSPMDGHSIHDGHAPVDEGDYHHGKVMEHAQAALAKARGEG